MKKILQGVFLAAMVFLSGAVSAQQAWPNGPIRIIVTTQPGIAVDVFARLYAEKLSKNLGVPVFVENKPGSAGIVGTDAAAKAAPDGNTVLWGYNSLFTINPNLYAKLPFDPMKDLVPVVQHLNASYILVANNDFPAKTFKEFIDLAQSKKKKITYASFGAGTIAHLAMEMIELEAKISLVHVPYKQGAVNDVIAGHVNMMVQPTTGILPLITSGKVRALAATGKTRNPLLPDLPTIAETLPGVAIEGWHGIWVPAGTPRPIIDRLHAEFMKITKSEEMQKQIANGGFEPAGKSPEETEAMIRKEFGEWGNIIRTKGIKIE